MLLSKFILKQRCLVKQSIEEIRKNILFLTDNARFDYILGERSLEQTAYSFVIEILIVSDLVEALIF